MLKSFVAIALATLAAAQQFSINTPPSIQQCQPAAITWVGGKANYILAAIPAGQVSAPALANIANSLTGNSYTWNVNLEQGTAISLKITDADGNIAYSSPLTVQEGPSRDCLSGGGGAGGSNGNTTTSATNTVSSGVATASPSGASGVSSSVASRSSSAAAVTSSAAASVSSARSTSAGNTTPVTSAPASATSSSAAAFGVKAELPAVLLGAIGAFAAML